MALPSIAMQGSITRYAVAAMLLALPLAAAAGNNLVVNGSFEDVDSAAGIQLQPAGSWSVYDSLPGWTSTHGIEVRNANVGTALDGQAFVELDAYQNSSISQTLATQAGASYELSFWYAPRVLGVSAGDTNDIALRWNGSTLATLSGNSAGWQAFTYRVTGLGHDVLSFDAVGRSDSLGGSLDAVSLTALPSLPSLPSLPTAPVPEVSTWVMLAAGLLAIFLMNRQGKE